MNDPIPMSAMSRRAQGYERLSGQPGFGGPDDRRLPPARPHRLGKLPYSQIKGIVLAVVLLLLGIALITMAMLLLTGLWVTEFWDRGWALLFLGCLVFLPGSYHVFIAIQAWRGVRGYSFSDIPGFE